MTDLSSTAQVSRRTVLRKGAIVSSVTLLGLGASGSATAQGAPDFTSRVWGDGETWGTKVTGEIKHPNEQSLDKFFVITNPVTGMLPEGTLPVSEAAPGNSDYNGGRWWTHTVAWTEAGKRAHGPTPPLLTRYGPADDPESILFHYNLGHLEISEGSPSGGPPDFFRCPLLPDKSD
ncbi:hypothetical protein ACH9L7_06345 [Haloferax sp. S1W]|uniref:hypothetical protein n=1 Tax=Haloferax sp. S1W TaxID=3377110 RepID=UPI0037C72FDA